MPDKFSIELFADDVVTYLEKNNLENIDVFGYSMGGYVAFSLQLKAQTEHSIEENESYMKMANELAKTAANEGNYPFGAVVVKNGVVVGKGYSHSHTINDTNAHGEIMAIRDAYKNLGTERLEGCELYTNCEPCPMCVAACISANIKHIYFGATKEDMAEWGVIDLKLYEPASGNIESEVILREDS
ncbi:unnamed protein product, partial [Rotaria sp. Silwood2]